MQTFNAFIGLERVKMSTEGRMNYQINSFLTKYIEVKNKTVYPVAKENLKGYVH